MISLYTTKMIKNKVLKEMISLSRIELNKKVFIGKFLG